MAPQTRLGPLPSPRTLQDGRPRVPAPVIAVAGMLLGLVVAAGQAGHAAYAQTADSSIDFAENRTAPVGVFIAHDQDGDPIAWSLAGPDEDLFSIDGGVLTFGQPPDYENPRSRTGGNLYRVTLVVGRSTHDVAVTVADVDEAGAVLISRPQPQVERPLSASLLDEDEGVSGQRWQWARSVDGTTWTDIEGATSPRRSPASEGEGTYLRATVTYADKFGTGKTASAASAYRVEARTLSNAAPSFAEQDEDEATPYVDIARSIPENSAIAKPVGRPVSATDADDDILFYELLDTPDLADDEGRPRFTIDSASGLIRVAKVLGADPGETEDETVSGQTGSPAIPANDAENSKYVLRVRASDPSTASATVNVVVTVADVNEPPRFADSAPAVLRVRENEEPPAAVGAYVITDEDGRTEDQGAPHAYDDTNYTYRLSGADSNVLAIDAGGVLSFREGHRIDYEKQGSYSITIEAHSGDGPRRLAAALDVTIEVVDAEDPGEVSLSQREPQIGKEVHATVSDPDGGVRVTSWAWYRSAEITADENGTPCRDDRGAPVDVVGGWTRIDGASSPVYTVRADDVDRCLRADATYTDDIGEADGTSMAATERPVQRRRPANTAPDFVVQSDSTSRSVAENTEAGHDIGRPVSAHDDDGDLLIYTLGGADAASFGISRNNGQLKAMAPLDYEARRSYTVEVTVTDPSGAADSIAVTIRLTNRDEPARITGNSFIDFAENESSPVASFSARDPERRPIRWSLNGRDAGRFTISRGVLRFRERPDYEDPRSELEGASLAARNEYRVTIEAGGGAREVTVAVTDVDEAGTASMDRPQPQVDRPLTASLRDQDEDVAIERWQWAESEDGMTWMDIEGATSSRRSPATDDVGMYLRATVTYSDKFGAGKTVSAVSSNRVEARTTANAAPSFAGQDENKATTYVDIARSAPENSAVGMSIGDPVSATDVDEDVLFYELLDTPDLADEGGQVRFTIDSDSGQVRVAKVLGADDGEREDEDASTLTGEPALPGDENAAGDEDNSEYVLRVRASDPSTASAMVNVIVTVADVNEPPTFDEDAPTLLRIREITAIRENRGTGEDEDPLVPTLDDGETPIDAHTYAVTDPDGREDANYTYTLSGPDRSALTFNSEGVLSFRPDRKPDYERKISYSVTITARSGVGSRRLTARLDVVIEVVNEHDLGEVTLSERQPNVGIDIEATLSDPDGGVDIIRWVWERSAELNSPDEARCRNAGVADGWTSIGGASSAVYVPKPVDVGRCLRATASYTDSLDDTVLDATGVLEFPVEGVKFDDPAPSVNAAPAFPDQDFLTPGVQSDRTSREVAENTKAAQHVGAPVSADDADEGHRDKLIYTLDGPDARAFDILRNTGQIRTWFPLNYEARNTYTVVVTARDPLGATASIVVTINVTDEDDPAEITVNATETDRGP